MKAVKNMFAVALAGLFAMVASFGALAAEPDYTTITGAVSFTGVITAFLAIGVILMGVYVAWKGIKLIVNMLRGG